MKTWNFTFKIETIAEKVYEEDWEDINDGDRKLIYIVFNNLRRRVLDSVMDILEFKSTPECLTVKVTEEELVPFIALTISCFREMSKDVYLEELCEVFPYADVVDYYDGQKIGHMIDLLILKTDVIQ